MTQAQAARLPFRQAIPVAVIIISLGYIVWALWPIFALVEQWLLIIALLLAFRYWPPVVRLFKTMPVPHRLVFGALVSGLILGHLTLRPAPWFPFTAWGIFSQATHNDPVTCPEFIGTTQSGREVHLLTEQLFPSIIQIWPMNTDKLSPEVTDRLALVLVRAYNAHHPGDPVQKANLVLVSVKIQPPPGAQQIQPSCQLLKRYDISSGR